jgi:hypothetical protein
MKESENKLVKRFLLRGFFLFAIIVVIDYSIGNILNYFYFKQKNGLRYRTTYSMEQTKADVIIFGSSRASHHYHPDVFEERLNSSCYNAGQDGNTIFYHSAILKCILKRHTPKIVLLDFIGEEFRKNQQSYDRLSYLLPYYKTHPEIRSIVELKSPYERMKMLSSIYPYNSSMFAIAAGNAKFNAKRNIDIKGYIPLEGVWNEPIITDNTQSNYEVDSNKVSAYNSFIKDCINSGTRLYIICSPYFFKTTQTDISFALAMDIAKKNNIQFFNFFSDSMFTSNPALFSDMVHLNDQGAKIFSNKVIDRMLETGETKIDKLK